MGHLLEYFKSKKHKVLGIEPANVIAKDAEKGICTLNSFFDIFVAKQIVDQYGYADLITINNLFGILMI